MLDIKFDKNGLVPAIAQDYETKEVLMLGQRHILQPFKAKPVGKG